MCTLALLRRPGARFPLVVAANRDERLDRPSTPPLRWDDPVPFVGGRDELAGGTWLGVNAHGLVIGLTNHWTGIPPDPERASRGDVVRSLLQSRSLDEVRERLAARDSGATNPFLLLAASRDGDALWTASADGLRVRPIDDGVFALGNEAPDVDPGHRARTWRRGVGALDTDDPEALRATLADRLAHHDGDRGPRESVCVHTDRGYGTVSSLIVLLGRSAADDRLWSAPGPPCTAVFTDHADLLRGLAPEG
mgnify:CR=1 FL=1